MTSKNLLSKLLLALALGRRHSEIHALSYSKVWFFEDSLSLGMFPGFLTKNLLLSVPSSTIFVPSLKGENVDVKLCPVRALKIYLARVLPRRKNRKRLLMNLEFYEKEISSDSIFQYGLYRQSSSPMSRTVLRYPRLMLMKCGHGHLPGHVIIRFLWIKLSKLVFGPLRIHLSDSISEILLWQLEA